MAVVQDDELLDSDEDEGEKLNNAKELAGMRVRHDADELGEGETMILTLADRNILDEHGEVDEDKDELENALVVRLVMAPSEAPCYAHASVVRHDICCSVLPSRRVCLISLTRAETEQRLNAKVRVHRLYSSVLGHLAACWQHLTAGLVLADRAEKARQGQAGRLQGGAHQTAVWRGWQAARAAGQV